MGRRGMNGSEIKRMMRLRTEAFFAQKGICYYCPVEMVLPSKDHIPFDRTCTAEHRIRWADGGKATPGNIVAACCRCNHFIDIGYKICKEMGFKCG